ncbi:MAG TPA: arginine deiminase family protein [Cyclobacteriaceae bacterium]|nr:arginine deiminase family protein [Cyclobacteriaceae bacterium]
MKTTCHSEYGRLVTVMLKKAGDAFIDERTLSDQWKPLNFLSKPDLRASASQYATFENILTSAGAKPLFLPADKAQSIDSIYCRDASIVSDFGVVLCNMSKANRAEEPAAEGVAFGKHGVKILGIIKSPGTLEGGDCAWIDEKTFAVGHTYRTNEEGIRQLRSFLEPHGIEVLVAQMPHYRGPSDVFHLMSVFSPVDKDLAVVYSPLMPISFRDALLRRNYRFVEVPDSEFDSMGCNVLAIEPRKCVMVRGNPETKARMEKAGCTVIEYDGSEISVKGGGGPTCLTRPLDRMI